MTWWYGTFLNSTTLILVVGHSALQRGSSIPSSCHNRRCRSRPRSSGTPHSTRLTSRIRISSPSNGILKVNMPRQAAAAARVRDTRTAGDRQPCNDEQGSRQYWSQFPRCLLRSCACVLGPGYVPGVTRVTRPRRECALALISSPTKPSTDLRRSLPFTTG